MRLAGAVLTLVALSAAAQARRVAAVGVPLDTAAVADAENGARAVAAFLQSDARFEWVSPAVQARDDGPVREAKAIEARRMFGEAREQLDNLAFPKAIATLDKTIKFYEDSDLSVGVGGLLDALALRAIASLSKNDKGGFNNDAQRVLAIAPDYAWDPSRLTPAAQAALEPLKKKSKAAAPASLELVSTPPGAWAFVDGVFRGVTPATVPGLAPGSHVVTLVATGYELVQEKVFAGSGTAPSFTLKSSARGKEVLSRIAEVRAALERDDAGAAAGTLAKFIQAEEVLIAAVRNKKGVLQAVVVRVLSDGTVVGQSDRPLTSKGFADWQALAKEVLAKEAPAPKHVELKHGGLEEVPLVTGHPGRRPVGWISAAVAVASVGAGIGLGLASKASADAANKTPQVDTAGYAAAASRARTQAAVADGLFGLAIVAGGVSIFMLVTGYSESEGGTSEEESTAFFLAPARDGAVAGLQGRF